MSRADFAGFSVDLPPDWDDVTNAAGGDLPTIARVSEDAKGALQVSLAEYRSGAVPKIDRTVLQRLRDDFATNRRLGVLHDPSTSENHLIIVAGSYHSLDDFVRVWYVSDRTNVALVTYVCERRFREKELAACEKIVKTFRFAASV